jgi:putative flippase GtrA
MRKHRGQILRFVIVGAVTFAIYFSAFRALYASVGFSDKMAVSIAYAITVSCHYFFNRFFTFQATDQELAPTAGKYALLLCVNYLVTLAVMWIFVDLLHGSPYLGVAATTAATTGISFFTMKYFVFNREGST